MQAGPFTETKFTNRASWGDLATKLLGIYEAELFPHLEREIGLEPGVVFNIGCAEGYYSIGFACRLPSTTVYALDTSALAQAVCHDNAVANNVSGRVRIEGTCTAEYLEKALKGLLRPLILMDCEGYEKELLLQTPLEAFTDTNIIVECHEFVHPGITDAISTRFAETLSQDGGSAEGCTCRWRPQDSARYQTRGLCGLLPHTIITRANSCRKNCQPRRLRSVQLP